MATRYDEDGYNSRGRRKIGYKPRTTRDSYGGLDSFYALQNRDLSSGEANDMATDMRSKGMGLSREGVVSPRRRLTGQSRGGRGQRRMEAPAAPDSAPGMTDWARQVLGPAAQPVAQDNTAALSRQRLQARAEEIRAQREMGTPQVQQSSPAAIAGGAPTSGFRSQYGTGSRVDLAPGAARPPATINGQSASGFFQDAADRQGVDNKFASTSSGMDPKKWRKALSRSGNTAPTRTGV